MKISLENMDLNEKFIVLEALWESMSKDATSKGFTPNWHLEVLQEREERVKKQEASFVSLESLQNNIEKYLNENKNS